MQYLVIKNFPTSARTFQLHSISFLTFNSKVSNFSLFPNALSNYIYPRIPAVKLKIPGKIIFEIRIQNFCYIQVIFFDL